MKHFIKVAKSPAIAPLATAPGAIAPGVSTFSERLWVYSMIVEGMKVSFLFREWKFI